MKGPRTTPTTRNQKGLQSPNSSLRKELASVFGAFQRSFFLCAVRGPSILLFRLSRGWDRLGGVRAAGWLSKRQFQRGQGQQSTQKFHERARAENPSFEFARYPHDLNQLAPSRVLQGA